MIPPGPCQICEEEKLDGSSRLTVIGMVCKDCYPTYNKIHDKVRTSYNECLKKRLEAIEL
jgi:hypothetical protein